MLTSGGHNVGIVNPPSGPGASRAGQLSLRRCARPMRPYQDAQAWFDAATPHPGSWWPDGQTWLAAHSGALVPAPPIGGKGPQRLKPLYDAPGRYVHET